MEPLRWHEAAPVGSGARLGQIALLLLVSGLVIPVGAGLVLGEGGLRFEVTAGELVVDVDPGILASQWRAPLASLRGVELASHAIRARTRGTQKPGHCSGWFVRDQLGRVREASACTLAIVVVQLPDETWALGPADREGLARALRSGTPGVFGAPPAPPAPAWWRVIQVLVVALLALPLLLLATILVPLRYGVENGQLHVRSPVGRRRFDIGGASARVVDRARIGWRVLGMSMPGAWLGIFRVEGQSTHVWATRRTGPAVLLEGSRRVLVTPADPQALLADLQASGAR